MNTCLALTQFGMGNTLLSFRDQHYEHGGSCNPLDRGLTIGRHKSTWLADLVAAWILQKTESPFRRTSSFHGICRDDGIVEFKNKWTVKQIDCWIRTFQLKVNNPCGDKDLQFAISMWDPDDNGITMHNECMEIYREDHFPFLDLDMHWNFVNKLKLKVCMKKNQKLKHLNSDSTHMKHCVKQFLMDYLKD